MQNANNKSYNNKSNNANCYESCIVMYSVVSLWGLFRFRSECSFSLSLFSVQALNIGLFLFIVFLFSVFACCFVALSYWKDVSYLFSSYSELQVFFLIQNSHLNESFLPFFSFLHLELILYVISSYHFCSDRNSKLC